LGTNLLRFKQRAPCLYKLLTKLNKSKLNTYLFVRTDKIENIEVDFDDQLKHIMLRLIIFIGSK